uniref:Tachykinin 1 n=1 Tax=Podarcis muralis TaxID=64176 RepID=A0A670JYR8_PODMU
ASLASRFLHLSAASSGRTSRLCLLFISSRLRCAGKEGKACIQHTPTPHFSLSLSLSLCYSFSELFSSRRARGGDDGPGFPRRHPLHLLPSPPRVPRAASRRGGKRAAATMKFLAVLTVLFLVSAQAFAEELGDNEELNYWSDWSDGDQNKEELPLPFEHFLQRIARRPRPQQFYGLMGKRDSGYSPLSHKSKLMLLLLEIMLIPSPTIIPQCAVSG